MTPEAKVKTAIRKALADAGVWYFMPVSNGMGRHGIPDFICCVNGFFLAIEAKAGAGKPTALQERELQLIRDTGGVALVMWDGPEYFHQLGRYIAALKHRSPYEQMD